MIKAILTDIEGTITRISFVKDVLFPYAEKQLPEFIHCFCETPEVFAQLDAVKNEINNQQATIAQLIDTLLAWIREDKKITALKQLQGMIWEKGYQQGDFTGHLYSDAVEFIREQCKRNIPVYVYSSGSVKAQKLLFSYSDFGDILELFSGFYDTKIGGKKEMKSYQNIIEELNIQAENVLFLSDIAAELDAAKQAGLKTCQLVRDNQKPSKHHPWVNNFNKFIIQDYS
ncbi:haloacid dehalogenase [Piscirickettsia salmonis]|uniref:Enolase-phosphatase E1 n=1 Tax=Piscirickettsia salmonis TaxID=1238 RepID=A0A9Q5YKW8_PISSA|nr:acireductone synthase [Piscirickettsia salmonis]ALA23990.1 2,3-diketo-5-methylthio-1-phosphopentane phosphatase [Piscirickettsia salmonis]APS44402.1 haloacid dehalogenase [Piscirickettsia salmonis]APS47763.1 haloacid dehalogenase [Piscirickettsia salmonis]APS50807.1 haloacid dehalogenase [Piscirickettsia salmonis]APS54011.1 haloacid dehalogenase [Piscirickettsia salmonis]